MTRPTFSPAPSYRDPKAALAWLERAFGFEPAMVVLDAHDNLAHAEMRLGDGLIMVGGEYDERHASPLRVDGRNTQSVHVQLTGGIDAHCERARAAGATIVREPADQPYGDRVYAAIDPEGHLWSFGQTLQRLSDSELEKAEPGFTVRRRL